MKSGKAWLIATALTLVYAIAILLVIRLVDNGCGGQYSANSHAASAAMFNNFIKN